MPGIYDHLKAEIEARDTAAGISAADLLLLPRELAEVLQRLTRAREADAAELAEALGTTVEELAPHLATLVDKGYVRQLGETAPRYRVNYGRRRARTMPGGIWSRVLERTAPDDDAPDEPAGSGDSGAAPRAAPGGKE